MKLTPADLPPEARVAEMTFPTKIFFGPGALRRLSAAVGALGSGRALVVTDPGVAKAGLAARVAEELGRAGVGCETWAEASLHEKALSKGAERFRAGGFGRVVGVGGGAALDAAKWVAALAASPGPLERFKAADGIDLSSAPPVVAVPTAPGAGTEVNGTAVASLESGRRLRVSNAHLLPRLAVCDADLCLGLTAEQLAVAGLEAFASCVEAYLSGGFHPLADALAIDGVGRVARSLPVSVLRPRDVSALSDLLVASLEAGMAAEKGLGACRALAHALASRSKAPHGLFAGVVLTSVLELNRGATTARLARVAVALGDNSLSRQEVLAGNAIERIRRLVAALPVPKRLGELEVAEDDLGPVADEALAEGWQQPSPRKCSKADLLGALRDSF